MALPIEQIESAIAELPLEQLHQFRDWYEKFDAEAWDAQLETDIANGKLDALADVALAEHKAGKSRPL